MREKPYNEIDNRIHAEAFTVLVNRLNHSATLSMRLISYSDIVIRQFSLTHIMSSEVSMVDDWLEKRVPS